jgi:hypothetical protein
VSFFGTSLSLLSESELHNIVAAAASYCRQTFALGYSGIVFEARMRTIESGTEAAAAWQQERLAQLDRRKGVRRRVASGNARRAPSRPKNVTRGCSPLQRAVFQLGGESAPQGFARVGQNGGYQLMAESPFWHSRVADREVL